MNFNQAQKRLTFEGNDFSVIFTVNSETYKMQSIEYSSNGKWSKYKVVKTINNADKSIDYQCKDLTGKNFVITFYPNSTDYFTLYSTDEAFDKVLEKVLDDYEFLVITAADADFIPNDVSMYFVRKP